MKPAAVDDCYDAWPDLSELDHRREPCLNCGGDDFQVSETGLCWGCDTLTTAERMRLAQGGEG